MRLTARVPATSANLGPGFDCFGLALDLCNEVTIDTDAEPGVSWDGEGADELPTDGTDLVSSAMLRAAADLGGLLPALSVRAKNRIPLERGIGSSAAARVAGVALATRLLDPETADDQFRVFSVVAELEGHPDNAAAAVFGGFTMVLGGRAPLVRRFDPHPGLRPVLLVPDGIRISTAAARQALPDHVRFRDATINAARSALTAAAIVGEPDLLFPAMVDRLHEDERLSLAPAARAVFDRIREAGFAVCVSGSGPSLLAFDSRHGRVPDPGEGWQVLRVPVRSTGFEIAEG